MKNTNITVLDSYKNSWSDKIVDRIDTIEDAGLNWDVVKTPMVAMLEGKYPLPIQSHVSINRTDTNNSIGVVGSKYEPIQNSRIWEALHQSLDGVSHQIQGAGYVNGGAKVFIQTKIESEDFKVNGDDFNNIVTFFSSHDGSSAFEMFDTSVRIICSNTVQAARRQGGKAFKLKVRHTSNASIRFENVMQHLESIFDVRKQTYADLNRLATVGMDYNDLINWATSFYNRSNKLTTVSSNKAHETKRLAQFGMGNKGETAYDLLNGVTELITHGDRSSNRSGDAVWRSSELGAGADTKAKAFDQLTNFVQRKNHIARGQELRHFGETAYPQLIG